MPYLIMISIVAGRCKHVSWLVGLLYIERCRYISVKVVRWSVAVLCLAEVCADSRPNQLLFMLWAQMERGFLLEYTCFVVESDV